MKFKLQDFYKVAYDVKALSSSNLDSAYVSDDTLKGCVRDTRDLLKDLCALTKGKDATIDAENEKKRTEYFKKLIEVEKHFEGQGWVSIGKFKKLSDDFPDWEIDLDKNPKLLNWAFDFIRKANVCVLSEAEAAPFFVKMFPKKEFERGMKNQIKTYFDEGLYSGSSIALTSKVNSHFAETRKISYYSSFKTYMEKAFLSLEEDAKTFDDKVEILSMGITSPSTLGNSNKKVVLACAERLFDVAFDEFKDFEKAKEILFTIKPNQNYYPNSSLDWDLIINKKTSEYGLVQEKSLYEIFENQKKESYVGSSYKQNIYVDSSFQSTLDASQTRIDLIHLSLSHFFVKYAEGLGLSGTPGTRELKTAIINYPNLKKAVELEPVFEQILIDVSTVIAPNMLEILKESGVSKFPNTANGATALAEAALVKYKEFESGRSAYFLNKGLDKVMSNIIPENEESAHKKDGLFKI